jgi:hypothetical protein
MEFQAEWLRCGGSYPLVSAGSAAFPLLPLPPGKILDPHLTYCSCKYYLLSSKLLTSCKLKSQDIRVNRKELHINALATYLLPFYYLTPTTRSLEGEAGLYHHMARMRASTQ